MGLNPYSNNSRKVAVERTISLHRFKLESGQNPMATSFRILYWTEKDGDATFNMLMELI
jgi:hypothetical protein